MSTINITSSKVDKTYTLENENISIQGSAVTDQASGELKNLQGNCYRAGQGGAYIGNFNGVMRDQEMHYSLSEMTRRDSSMVWDAIDEIESYILGGN